MTNPDYLQCPKSDTVVENRINEAAEKSLSCKKYCKKKQFLKRSTSSSGTSDKKNAKLKKLMQYAKNTGATEAEVISTINIVVEEKLANMCLEPRCENYGFSKNCPPYVSGPSRFKKQLENFNQAIVFKIDVPSEILFSSERRELFQLLHEIAAGIEQYAVKMGFKNSKAYAGGSCKKIFCYDHPECLALSEKGKCRNPKYARPSMSGFGINVLKLMETAGLTMNMATPDTDSNEIKMGSVCGLVLIC
jgi:predicted metal-binding protein